MIPYAVLQGELYTGKREKLAIRILDLSLEGFTFRLVKSRKLAETEKLVLYFWSWKISDFVKLEFDNVQVQLTEEEDFYFIYRIEINDSFFERAASELMKEYLHYIDLKQYEEDAELSEVLTGYPAAQEKDFPESLEQWEQRNLSAVQEKLCRDTIMEEKWREVLSRTGCLGIELESDGITSAFREMEWETFQNFYWKEQRLKFHPVSACSIHFVYLGNGYCFERLPSAKLMTEMIRKAEVCNVVPVLVLPPMKERYRELFQEYLREIVCSLPAGEKKLETVVNDWGTLELVRKSYSESLTPIMGILMNKRRKDSRMEYRCGLKKQLALLRENGSNTEFFREYLFQEYGLSTFLYESCGYEYDFPEGEQNVLFPFYQMNTAGHCTLFAQCRNGSRGKQIEEGCCPGFCKQFCFLYPSMLSIVGWQNSLFGWDEKVLWDADYFEMLSNYGTNRMILNELHFTMHRQAIELRSVFLENS